MERITQKDLKILVGRINKATNSPLASYTQNGKEGERKPGFTANINNYHLDYAYGGVQLAQMVNIHGGIRIISTSGLGTKRELYNWMQAFLAGMAQNN